MGNPYAKEVKFLFLAQLLLFLGILFKGKTAGGFLCLVLGFSVPIFVVAIISLCRSKHSEGRKGKTSGVVGILLELPVIAALIWALQGTEPLHDLGFIGILSPSVLVFGITWAIRRKMQQSKQEQHDDTIPDGEKPETLDARTGRKLSLPVVVIIAGVVLMAGSVVYYTLGNNDSNAIANTDIDSNTKTLPDLSFSYTDGITDSPQSETIEAPTITATDWDSFECEYYGDLPIGLLGTPDATADVVQKYINDRLGTNDTYEVRQIYNAYHSCLIEIGDVFEINNCKGKAIFYFDWNYTLYEIDFEFYDEAITPAIMKKVHSDIDEIVGGKCDTEYLIDTGSDWTHEEISENTSCSCIWHLQDDLIYRADLYSYFNNGRSMSNKFGFERIKYKNKSQYQNSSTDGAYFTNKYGTATTICAHSGCTNYIASSGDTNCCITHSNKCLECGCYIDEDAAWCVSCITRAAKQAKNNSVHYCEECGKEAAYSIIGITGAKEYYCYTHYKEMQEIMEWLTKN